MKTTLDIPDEIYRELKIREWMENESAFLESMRGPVFGDGAVADLFGGRR